MENLHKNITELLSKGGIAAALLIVVLYFGNLFIKNMNETNKELALIRTELVKIQTNILTTEQVEKMIDTKIKLLEYKFHSKECDTLK